MVLGVVFDLVLDGLDDAMDFGFCREKKIDSKTFWP